MGERPVGLKRLVGRLDVGARTSGRCSWGTVRHSSDRQLIEGAVADELRIGITSKVQEGGLVGAGVDRLVKLPQVALFEGSLVGGSGGHGTSSSVVGNQSARACTPDAWHAGQVVCT